MVHVDEERMNVGEFDLPLGVVGAPNQNVQQIEKCCYHTSKMGNLNNRFNYR